MKHIAILFFTYCFYAILRAQVISPNNNIVQIQYTPGHPAQTFIPEQSLGAAFDGHSQGDIKNILTPENIASMKTVGLNSISYRLRTELGIEAWHWNPNGQWSEPGKQEGYWTSDNFSNQPIQLSNGYRLPRRGNTHDQANDDGYSRLDDGDTKTFWKSNPYLDAYYTKEPDSQHPQWVIVDLGRLKPVNAIRILWSDPYALSFKVDYALDNGNVYFDPLVPNTWHDFVHGNFTDQQGGDKIISVSSKPVMVRYIRIIMTKGSATTKATGNDARDNLGFAIAELYAGEFKKDKKFYDWVHHAADNENQSTTYASSTDPWHRAEDIDMNTEQAGIDLFFQSGITGKQPAMIPVGLLYDNPDNMKALVQYLVAKKYPVDEIEMGEEPDGQLAIPIDFAALYCQWATAFKKVSPSIRMGGPSFATLASNDDDEFSFTERQWTRQFLTYLKDHGHFNDFNFFSFEWYPFDDVCSPTAPQLAEEPELLDSALKGYPNNVLPDHVPIYITEYGYSAHSGRAEVEIEGALMYADILGQALTLGTRKCFLYGYEPGFPDENAEHCSWGNNMLFGMGENGKIIYQTAAYHGMKMLMEHWAAPVNAKLEIYPAACPIRNKKGQSLITAYAIHRPDGSWSLLMINKDPSHIFNIDMSVLNTTTGMSIPLRLPLESFQYSSQQYHWVNKKADGHPSLSLPPAEKIITTGSSVSLPPYSVTVVTETGNDKK
jgi:hypothetical protein